MNPNHNKVVRFRNISTKDFTHPFEGRPYFVKAGQTLLMPFDLADHLATHLARTILLAKADSTTGAPATDQPLWSEQAIEDLKVQILGDSYEPEVAPELNDQEKMAARVKELNTNEPDTSEGQGADPGAYKDKAEVIARMKELGLPFNPRAGKATLLKELAAAEQNVAKA